jgi:hypothetical protein
MSLLKRISCQQSCVPTEQSVEGETPRETTPTDPINVASEEEQHVNECLLFSRQLDVILHRNKLTR